MALRTALPTAQLMASLTVPTKVHQTARSKDCSTESSMIPQTGNSTATLLVPLKERPTASSQEHWTVSQTASSHEHWTVSQTASSTASSTVSSKEYPTASTTGRRAVLPVDHSVASSTAPSEEYGAVRPWLQTRSPQACNNRHQGHPCCCGGSRPLAAGSFQAPARNELQRTRPQCN